MMWNEEDHPRDDIGRFAKSDSRRALKSAGYDHLSMSDEWVERLVRDLGLNKTVKLPDETLPRSIGAKWANYEIDLPNGEKAKFVEGSKLQNKEVFAGKGCRRKIDDAERLIAKYPGSRSELWMKVKALAYIELPNSEIIKAEVHWYEEPTIGKVEFKLKAEEE